ncbi:YhfH family protein [Anoxybacillus ayderensis]|nr:YhfH family protein [Anoxybacillus ayderensis]
MLEKMSEFYKKSPPKTCCECGKEMEEQHECYGNVCVHCLNVSC